MPRAISVRRKYLPALSIALSLPSSQRSLRGRRKPWGGGPAGVAARREDEVNVAAGDVVRAEQSAAVRGVNVGRVARASTVSERVDAMMIVVDLCGDSETERLKMGMR